MNIKVHLLAFCDYDYRIVNNISPTDTLDDIFREGQNDFNPQNKPSVSAGDVIERNNELYLVMSRGFKKITVGELIQYVQVKREDRYRYWM